MLYGLVPASAWILVAFLATATATSKGSITCGETVTGDTADGFHTVGSAAKEHYYQITTGNTSQVYTFAIPESSSGSTPYLSVWEEADEDGDDYLVTLVGNGWSRVGGDPYFFCPDCSFEHLQQLLQAILTGDEWKTTIVLDPGKTYYVVVETDKSHTAVEYSMALTCAALNADLWTDQGRSGCGETSVGSAAKGHYHQITTGNTSQVYTFSIPETVPDYCSAKMHDCTNNEACVAFLANIAIGMVFGRSSPSPLYEDAEAAGEEAVAIWTCAMLPMPVPFLSVWKEAGEDTSSERNEHGLSRVRGPFSRSEAWKTTIALDPGTTYYVVVENDKSHTSAEYSMTLSCAALGTADQGRIGCGETVTGNTADGFHAVGSAAKEHYYQITTGKASQEYTFAIPESSSGSTPYLSVWEDIRYINGWSRVRVRGSMLSSEEWKTAIVLDPGKTYYVVVETAESHTAVEYSMALTCAALGTADQGRIGCGETVNRDTVDGYDAVGSAAKEHYYQITTGKASQEYTFAIPESSSGSTPYLSVWEEAGENVGWSRVGGYSSGNQAWKIAIVLDPGKTYYVVVETDESHTSVGYSMALTCAALGTADQGRIGCGETVKGDTADGFHTVGSAAKEHYYQITTGNTSQVYTFAIPEPSSGSATNCSAKMHDCTNNEACVAFLANIAISMMFERSSAPPLNEDAEAAGEEAVAIFACAMPLGVDPATPSGDYLSTPYLSVWEEAGEDGNANNGDNDKNGWSKVVTKTPTRGAFIGGYGSDDGGDRSSNSNEWTTTIVLDPGKTYYVIVETDESHTSGKYSMSLTCADQGRIGCGETVTGNTVDGYDAVGSAAKEHSYQITTGKIPEEYTFAIPESSSGSTPYVSVWEEADEADDDDSYSYVKIENGWSRVRGPFSRSEAWKTTIALDPGTTYYVVVETDEWHTAVEYSMTLTCAALGTADQGRIGCGETVTGNTVDGYDAVGSAAKEHSYQITTGKIPEEYTFAIPESSSGSTPYVSVWEEADEADDDNWYVENGWLRVRGFLFISEAWKTAIVLDPGKTYYVVVETLNSHTAVQYCLSMQCGAGSVGKCSPATGTSSTMSSTASSTMTTVTPTITTDDGKNSDRVVGVGDIIINNNTSTNNNNTTTRNQNNSNSASDASRGEGGDDVGDLDKGPPAGLIGGAIAGVLIVAAAAAFFVRRAQKSNATPATHQLSLVIHNQAYNASSSAVPKRPETAAIGRRSTQTQAPPGFATATPTVPLVPSRRRASTAAAAAAAALQTEGDAVKYEEPVKKQMVKYDKEKRLSETEYATCEDSAVSTVAASGRSGRNGGGLKGNNGNGQQKGEKKKKGKGKGRGSGIAEGAGQAEYTSTEGGQKYNPTSSAGDGTDYANTADGQLIASQEYATIGTAFVDFGNGVGVDGMYATLDKNKEGDDEIDC
eukprot:gene1252-11030_t